MKCGMTPSADESVKFLTQKLKNREPFVFTKFGDGDLFWMRGEPVAIAGGETYRDGINDELVDAASILESLSHTWFGNQLTCGSGPYLPIEQAMYVRTSRWLHFECLLIHRLSPELLEFYRVLREYKHKLTILYIAGSHLLGGTRFCTIQLHCDGTTAHRNWQDSVSYAQAKDWDVLLLSAGRASKMIAANLAIQFPTRTIIELGSALDPLFVGRTRSEQIDPQKAREYFKELL
jgi:hypothetical protein